MTERSREVALSLGSNLGDRAAHLSSAVDEISKVPGVKVVAKSPLYETEPVGVKPEYQSLAFLNSVVLLSTVLTTDELHTQLLRVEKEAGRERGGDRYAPRPLDIDILYAGDEVRQDEIKLPHPQCTKRRFVLQPLADLRADLVLPGIGRTVGDLLAELTDGEAVTRLPDLW
ncbi:MAG TPA: 2-amino-4-hydroxy-6-hydroxymethyldihydropteridine diphosphokinase [Kiritimatiellia bacterium]|nr:2-amino-4-hydroxy-6-hydroxymethyldihydropteridine diphosphokinase [Kiritimatiellia bacterium]